MSGNLSYAPRTSPIAGKNDVYTNLFSLSHLNARNKEKKLSLVKCQYFKGWL